MTENVFLTIVHLDELLFALTDNHLGRLLLTLFLLICMNLIVFPTFLHLEDAEVLFIFLRENHQWIVFYLLLGRVKKGGFIHNWVGGWVRKGTKSTKKNMFSKRFFRLENACTDLLIVYLMFTQNMRICATSVQIW